MTDLEKTSTSMSMMPCSLVQHWPRKPRIEFRISRKSKTKISFRLLELLKDLSYDLYEERLPKSDGCKDLVVVVFEYLIDFIKFWGRVNSGTDWYQKYIYRWSNSQKGTRMEWYCDRYQVDPYNLLSESNIINEEGIRGWKYLQISDSFLFVYTPGLTKYHLYEFQSKTHIYEVTPDAQWMEDELGVTIKNPS